MQDKFQYGDVLNTIQIPVFPEPGIAGRGLAPYEGSVLEFQTCLAVKETDDYGRAEAIRSECERMAERWTGRKAKPIPRIPRDPLWADFARLEETSRAISSVSSLPVGYETETADVCSLDLSRMYCCVISGKNGTGKTNLMRIMMHVAAEKKALVTVAEFGDPELKAEAEETGAKYIRSAAEYYQFMTELIPLFQERNAKKKQLREQGYAASKIFEEMSRETPCFIFLSDLADFIKTMYGPEGASYNFGNSMTNLLEKGSGLNIYFIACFNWEKRTEVLGTGIYNAFTGYRFGIHMGGASDAQTILTVTGFSLRERQKPEKAGIGVTSADETCGSRKIMVPLIRG